MQKDHGKSLKHESFSLFNYSKYHIPLNRCPLRIDAFLKLMPVVNQQIMSVNTGPQLDGGVSHPNATYSLEVVHVEDDARENKMLRRLI